MGVKTGIEWTDSTWNPIRVRVRRDAAEIARAKGYASLVQIAEKMAGHVGQHCEHVSPGCEHCYAESNNHRCLPANGTGLPYNRRSRDLIEAFVDEKALLEPLKWGTCYWYDSEDGRPGKERRRKIFVANQSDLFGDWVTDEMLDRVFAVMFATQQHTYQVLTKRPERMLEYFSPDNPRYTARRIVDAAFEMDISSHTFDCDIYFPLMNIWLGVSVENQVTADERIPLLLRTAAAVRFISAEPVLGEIDLSCIPWPDGWEGLVDPTSDGIDALRFCRDGREHHLDWVIAGGESGTGARPMHQAWADLLRKQCVAARVPFFFKQWGEWLPLQQKPACQIPAGSIKEKQCRWINEDGRGAPVGESSSQLQLGPENLTNRVGKKTAGALLDGRWWRQFPPEAGGLVVRP